MAGYVGAVPLLDAATMKRNGMEILTPVERPIGYQASETTEGVLLTVEIGLPISREDGIGLLITRWESQFSAPRFDEIASDVEAGARAWIHYGSDSPVGLGLNSRRILALRDERAVQKFDTAVGHSILLFTEYAHIPVGALVVTESIFVSTIGSPNWSAVGSLLSHVGRFWYYPVKLEIGAFVNAFSLSQQS